MIFAMDDKVFEMLIEHALQLKKNSTVHRKND